MLRADFFRHRFHFKVPGGTSRGVLKTKDSWIIKLWHQDLPERIGFGECSIIEGLSRDDLPLLERQIQRFCKAPENYIKADQTELDRLPALRFGIEQAMIDLDQGGERILFHSDFTAGTKSISINGLVWMGNPAFMKRQIDSLLRRKFKCIKLKVGAIDFEQELQIIKSIKERAERIEIRVDANGAFTKKNVFQKLESLAKLGVASIEQPVRPGQTALMKQLSLEAALDIALDEELIPHTSTDAKRKLLEQIRPPYIVLKPSLLGGFARTEEFIDIANELDIKWWITSALEGNVGLNAIAQWTAIKSPDTIHGLGTGSLFSNNFDSPLEVVEDHLHFRPDVPWTDLSAFS